MGSSPNAVIVINSVLKCGTCLRLLNVATLNQLYSTPTPNIYDLCHKYDKGHICYTLEGCTLIF